MQSYLRCCLHVVLCTVCFANGAAMLGSVLASGTDWGTLLVQTVAQPVVPSKWFHNMEINTFPVNAVSVLGVCSRSSKLIEAE